MANKNIHGEVGLLCGCLSGIYDTESNESETYNNLKKYLVNVSMGSFGGYVGALLPDIMEPAYGPYHRKRMHSVKTGLIIFGFILAVNLVIPKNNMFRTLFDSVSVGYISHLLLDSRTKMGLYPLNLPA